MKAAKKASALDAISISILFFPGNVLFFLPPFFACYRLMEHLRRAQQINVIETFTLA